MPSGIRKVKGGWVVIDLLTGKRLTRLLSKLAAKVFMRNRDQHG